MRWPVTPFYRHPDPRYIDLLSRSAPLHDIGKVGIPDQILLKPDKLTPAEWQIMRTHAKLGSDAIEEAERDIEQPLVFLTLAKEIAHWHHESGMAAAIPTACKGRHPALGPPDGTGGRVRCAHQCASLQGGHAL